MNDGELYELVGNGWRFPIYVKWIQTSLAEVTVADIPILKKQREAVEGVLKAHCDHRQNAGVWIFARKGLEQTAFKSAWTEPEDVVVWQRVENEVTAKADFVHAYCGSRDAIIRNPSVFTAIWGSISKFMLEWLLFKEGEVDLGFAKLSCVCARPNWKNVIIGRMIARRRNGLSADSEKARREKRRLLHQSFITSLDEKSRTVRWSLEITPDKSFHDAAEVLEIKRKHHHRGSYAYQILKLLKSNTHKNRMHALLDDYWRETRLPYAGLPHGFEPRVDADGQENAVKAQPAPSWVQTPVVDGERNREKGGRVAVPDEVFQLSQDDLRRLGAGFLHLPQAMTVASDGGVSPSFLPVAQKQP